MYPVAGEGYCGRTAAAESPLTCGVQSSPRKHKQATPAKAALCTGNAQHCPSCKVPSSGWMWPRHLKLRASTLHKAGLPVVLNRAKSHRVQHNLKAEFSLDH